MRSDDPPYGGERAVLPSCGQTLLRENFRPSRSQHLLGDGGKGRAMRLKAVGVRMFRNGLDSTEVAIDEKERV